MNSMLFCWTHGVFSSECAMPNSVTIDGGSCSSTHSLAALDWKMGGSVTPVFPVITHGEAVGRKG
jgi:hypothetical protein